MPNLPLLPTMGVESYASPGWMISAQHQIRDDAFGVSDIAELYDDAIRIAVADQIEADLDVISDGELRRQRFVFSMFDGLDGLGRVAPQRRLGIPGYDMAPTFIAEAPPIAPKGLGVAQDFAALKALAPDRPLKVALPGPLTFASAIDAAAVGSEAVLDAITRIVRDEVEALVAAGADFIQLDEPSLSDPPYDLGPEESAAAVNAVLSDISGRLAVHICFGNNAERPRADRRFGRMMTAMTSLACEQLVLEFANREMAEVELLAVLVEQFEIAAGVVDVKNWRLETADDVAERIRLCLDHMPAEKLRLTADCGFSALPRYLAREKMRALVAGARIVRNSL